jgi:signal transduction histidine kinase
VLFFVEEDFLRARVTARRALLTDHPDPTVAVDDEGRLLDYNDEAATLFEGLEPRASLESVAPALSAALSADAPRLSVGSRSFAIRRHDVPLWTDRTATTVVLREVTEAERHRAEIERQNEQLSDIAVAVAHNLRNASNVLQGHIGQVATTRATGESRAAGGDEVVTDASAGESLDIAAATAERVAAVAEDLRLLAELGQTVEHTAPVPLAGAAREAWDRCDADGVTLDCESFNVEADRRRQRGRAPRTAVASRGSRSPATGRRSPARSSRHCSGSTPRASSTPPGWAPPSPARWPMSTAGRSRPTRRLDGWSSPPGPASSGSGPARSYHSAARWQP